MALITLLGCNAIGKTTAAVRYKARYPALLTYSLDLLRKEYPGTEEKVKLASECSSSDSVCLIESVYSTHLAGATNLHVIVLTCDYQLYEKHMRQRCERCGKKFRDDYWTRQKLEYESGRRYLNYANKNLDPASYTHFEIQDQARDWPAVDEHFARLYRRLHNAILRAKS